jgi:hypothetical protein
MGCEADMRVCVRAVQHDNTNFLEYLVEQGEVLDAKLMTKALNLAGACNKLLAAQWLRQRGAQWPAVLKHGAQQWSGDALAWARAEGCTSPVIL